MNETITEELIQHLCQTAHVSVESARQALEQSGGDLLNALRWLEQEGLIPDAGVHTYSTREGEAPDPAPETQEDTRREKGGFRGQMKRWLIDNRLVAYHSASNIDVEIPIVVAVVLLALSFWMIAAVLCLGFFFGWRYRFAGPDLSREEVIRIMNGINDTAGDVVNNVKESWNSRKNGK